MVQVVLRDNENELTNEDFNFIISEKNVPDMPTQTLIQDEIPYRNTKVTYRRKDEARTIYMKIYFLVDDFEALNSSLNTLNEFLQNEVTIKFLDIDYEFRCNLVGEVNQDEISRHHRLYDLKFETVDTYKYRSADTISQDFIESGNIILSNNGNIDALPIIKITGTCDNLTIGTLDYSDAISDTLTIDCEKEICYNENGNKLPFLSGEFIKLSPGENELEVTGDNLDITVEITYKHTYR